MMFCDICIPDSASGPNEAQYFYRNLDLNKTFDELMATCKFHKFDEKYQRMINFEEISEEEYLTAQLLES